MLFTWLDSKSNVLCCFYIQASQAQTIPLSFKIAAAFFGLPFSYSRWRKAIFLLKVPSNFLYTSEHSNDPFFLKVTVLCVGRIWSETSNEFLWTLSSVNRRTGYISNGVKSKKKRLILLQLILFVLNGNPQFLNVTQQNRSLGSFYGFICIC